MKKGQCGIIEFHPALDERKAHPEHSVVIQIITDIKKDLGINFLSQATMNKIIEVVSIAINEMQLNKDDLGDYCFLLNIALEIVNNDFSKDSKVAINEFIADLKGAFGGNVPANWFRFAKTIATNIGGRKDNDDRYKSIILNLASRF